MSESQDLDSAMPSLYNYFRVFAGFFEPSWSHLFCLFSSHRTGRSLHLAIRRLVIKIAGILPLLSFSHFSVSLIPQLAFDISTLLSPLSKFGFQKSISFPINFIVKRQAKYFRHPAFSVVRSHL